MSCTSTSKYVITSADIETVPQVRAVDDLLALQPGMTLNGDNRIRGSFRSGQTGTMVGYYVDGVEVSRNQLIHVNTSAIQEISVLTGGMNAEFGNAGAGIVNLVSKEGRGVFQGRTEYKFTPAGKKHWGADVFESLLLRDNVRWDDPDFVNETYIDPGPDRVMGTSDDVERLAHERINYTNKRGHRFEGSLSGPITSDVSYFVSMSYAREPAIFPSVEQVVSDPPRVQTTLTYRPTSQIKVKALGMYQHSQGYEGASRNNNRNIFFPEDFSKSGTFTLSRKLAVLTLTHTLSSNTYYDLKFSYNGFDRDTSNVPAVTEPTRRDAQGYFNLPTLQHQYTEEEDINYGIKLDFVSQVNGSHLIQAGFALNRQGYHYTTVNFPNTRSRNVNFVADGFDLGKNINPWKLHLYIQDKIEFGGLIANLGLRWDYFNFGRKASMGQALGRSPMYNTFTRARYELDHMDNMTPTLTALGPRVGLSHPITEKLAAHYFIGRSYTFPEPAWTHRRSFQSDSPDNDLNNNGVIDSAELWNTLEVNTTSWQPSDGLKPQRSTSMEMGVDWNFVAEYTTSLTAHYRRDEGLYSNNNISYWIDPLSGQSIQVNALRNTFWLTARGLEVSLKKSFSNHFQFTLAYNAEWTRDAGGAHYGKYSANWYVMPDADFIKNGHYWTNWDVDPVTGAEIPVPLTPAEIANISEKAEANLQIWREQAGTQGPGVGPWQAPIKTNENGIWTAASGQVFSGEPADHQRQGQLSLQVYYATPNQYGLRLG
ncbi:MAG: TonB-dependent receptor plug domain-containing protein, partial [Candidatus Latescibacterota bacterium]